MGLVRFESHNRADPLLELDNLKDVVNNCSRNVNFLTNNFGKTFVVFSTMNLLTKDLNVYFLIDWKNVF